MLFQDTVLVPFGGYTVVRIFTDNPGYWLMHCHQMMHATEGMDVVIRVDPEAAPKVPPRFPMNCGNFDFTHEDFQSFLHKETSAVRGDAKAPLPAAKETSTKRLPKISPTFSRGTSTFTSKVLKFFLSSQLVLLLMTNPLEICM